MKVYKHIIIKNTPLSLARGEGETRQGRLAEEDAPRAGERNATANGAARDAHVGADTHLWYAAMYMLGMRGYASTTNRP